MEWESQREVVVISASVIGFPKPDMSFLRGQQLIDPNSPPDGHQIINGTMLKFCRR